MSRIYQQKDIPECTGRLGLTDRRNNLKMHHDQNLTFPNMLRSCAHFRAASERTDTG